MIFFANTFQKGRSLREERKMEENRKKGLGIAAIVLGVFSILCCSCMGLGVLVGIIGLIFSIICLVKGTGSGKTFGIVGIILNGIGILLGAYILIGMIMAINWANVNADTLNQINQIDVNDEAQVRAWLQQFFNVDLT
jgi:hypothetical protein